MRGRRSGTGPRARLARRLALMALGVSLFWAGNARTPLWDRDEPRFAQAAREMRARGDWVVPTFGGEGRYHKPPLAYWTILASTATLGDDPFGTRAGSGLAVALAALLAGFVAREVARGRSERERDRAETWAVLAALTMPLLFGIARLAIADGVLVLCVVTAQWTGLRLVLGSGGAGSALGFWIATAAGILAKGPIAPMVWVATLVAARCFAPLPDGWARRHRATWGVPLLLALVLPWALVAQQRTGGAFLREAIGVHVVERFLRPFEGHGLEGALGYLAGLPFHLVALPLLGLPWSVPALLGLVGWRRERPRSFEGAFLAGWVLGPLVVLSLAATKLPHYTAPLAPALAVWAGLWLAREGAAEAAGWRLARGALACAYVALALALAVAVLAAWDLSPRHGVSEMLGRAERVEGWVGLALCAAALIGAALWSARRVDRARWAGGMLVATLVFELALAWLALPAIGRLAPWDEVAEEVRRRAGDDATIRIVGEPEPGLVYALGAMPEVIDEREAMAILADPEPGLLIVDRLAVGDRLRRSIDPRQAGHRGIALAKGRVVEVVTVDRGRAGRSPLPPPPARR